MNSLDNPDTNQDETGIFNHLPAILWQRRWLVIIPLLAISILSFVASYFVPTVYRSSATFLVKSQELPQDFVSSPVTSVIAQRVERLRQQVLGRENLIRLIQKHDLYPDQRGRLSPSEISDIMRENTSIESVTGEVGQQNAANISFLLSFDHEDPVKAYLVTQDYANRFIELSSGQTREQAASTVRFLSTQVLELQKQISDLENRITGIKARNGAAFASIGLSNTPGSTGSYDAQIAALQRENSVLAQQASERPPEPRDPVVVAAEAQLAGAQAIYTDNHPDIRIARQRLEEARRLAASNYVPVRSSIPTQIAANNAQIAALGRARSQDLARTSAVSSSQTRAPVLMEQVAQLETRASALREQYQSTSTRLLNAQNSARMEAEDKGERLALTDPPEVPEDPISPSALVITVGGIAAGLLGGIAFALLIELLHKPLRGVGQVEALLGSPPLVVVPSLPKRRDARSHPWVEKLLYGFGFRGRSART